MAYGAGGSEGRDDEDWEILEERLGSPQDPDAVRRAEELEAQGWEVVSVLFEIWQFRRPKQHSN
jgi:hypothetical protein